MIKTDDESYRRLAGAGLVLTPNNRLAEYLREFLCERSANDNDNQSELDPSLLRIQALPAILPYQSWITELTAKATLAGFGSSRRVLSTVEETVLWQAIILSAKDVDLLSPALAAAEAQRASQLLQDWCVDASEHEFEFGSIPDCEIFYGWYNQFLQELDRRQFYTAGQAQAALLQLDTAQLQSLYALHANVMHESPSVTHATSRKSTSRQSNAREPGQWPIVTAGFYSTTPLQQQVMAHFSAAIAGGTNRQAEPVTPRSIDLSRDCATIATGGYENFVAEIRAAASWARAESAAAPDARIAIVVPDLAAQKNVVERIMRQAFYAQAGELDCSFDRSVDYNVDHYNISAGTALAKLPMVEVFLRVLEGILQPLAIDTWQSLLFSPYLFAQHDALAGRNLIVEAMYHSGESEFLLGEIPSLVGWYRRNCQPGQPTDPESHAELELIESLDDATDGLMRGMRSGRTASPSIWLDHFQNVLERLQWPGNRGLDSDEFQQQQMFSESCAAIWQSDAVVGEVGAGAALAFIRQHFQNTVYHRQTRSNQLLRPPQVLGVLEASGQLFDQLWVTGLSEQCWPARPATNALLPFSLQARLQMPGASEQREFDYAERVTRCLLQAAGQLRVSYVNFADGVEMRLAPVVTAYLHGSGVDIQACPLAESVAPVALPGESTGQRPAGRVAGQTSVAADAPFEAIEDYYGKPYPEFYDTHQRRVLRRGIAALRDCAINPLLAYARHRLELEPLLRPQPGLAALERGNALHASLERCWEQLQSSAELKARPAEQLASMVAESVAESLRAVDRQRYKRLGARFMVLQQSVFEQLLGAWLALEKERPSFTVEALEKSLGGQLGEFFISGRIDRIDRLANGQMLLIDYKTGSVNTQGWLDERLSSPQLPFYLLAAQNQAETNTEPECQAQSQALRVQSSEPGALPRAALAFASLKPGEVGFRGLAEPGSAASDIDGINDLRPAQREVYADAAVLHQHWLTALQQRCDEIARGFAALDLNLPSVASDGSGAYEPFIRSLAAANSQLEFGAAQWLVAAQEGDGGS